MVLLIERKKLEGKTVIMVVKRGSGGKGRNLRILNVLPEICFFLSVYGIWKSERRNQNEPAD